MDREELLGKIQEVREDRKISKQAKTAKKARGVRKKATFKSKLDELTPEQKAELIRLMEEDQ